MRDDRPLFCLPAWRGGQNLVSQSFVCELSLSFPDHGKFMHCTGLHANGLHPKNSLRLGRCERLEGPLVRRRNATERGEMLRTSPPTAGRRECDFEHDLD